MRRRVTSSILVVVTALTTLGGCGGAADTVTVSDSAPLDICEVVDGDLLSRLSDDEVPREVLVFGRETFVGCSTDGLSNFVFGVRAVVGDRPLKDYLDPAARPLPGLGDEALNYTVDFEGELALQEVVARRGDLVVFVRNARLTGVSGGDASTEDTTDVARELLKLSAGQVDAIRPVVVSDPCPTTDRVEEAIGSVDLARGGDVDDELGCFYLSRNLLRLSVGRYFDGVDYMGDGQRIVVDGAYEARYDEIGSRTEVSALDDDGTLWFASMEDKSDASPSVLRTALVGLVEDLIAAGESETARS